MNNTNGVETHPSYGTIRISRACGGPRTLFQSSIEHQHTIIIRISHAGKERMLNSDYIYDKGEIVEIELSQTQFAEMMTSIGQGSGVPCTIKSIEGKTQADPPAVSKSELHRQEFMDHQSEIMENISSAIERTKDIFKKNSVSKKDKEDILRMLEGIETQFGPNSSFQVKMFEEQMEQTIHEAKGEIEAFIQNKITSIASGKLIEQIDPNIITLPESRENEEDKS